MNRIQQDALGKALGMNGDSLADMLGTQKKNEASNQDTLSLQKDSIAAMTSMASLAEAIKNEEDGRLGSMGPLGDMYRQFESAMNKIATALMPIINTLFTELWNIVWPLFQGVEKWLTDSGNVKMMTEGIKSAFEGVKEFLTPIFEMLGKLAMDLVPVILVVWEKIKPVIMYVKNLIMEIVGSVGTLLNKLATGNGEFSTMEKIVGAIGAGLIVWKTTMLAVAGYKKAVMVYEKTSLAIQNAQKVVQGIQLGYQAAMGSMEAKRALVEKQGLIRSVGTAIMKVIGSLASIPVAGWALGLAAAGVVGVMAAKYMNDGLSKEGAVMIDGNKVGTTLALSNYKQQ